ncbi:hypothetical protein ACWXWB_01560 [Pantoea dispersa]|nr:hypothetical protein [Pantoea dispersa]
MQSILRTRLTALLTPERHLVWRCLLTGCSFFWILLVVTVMGLR